MVKLGKYENCNIICKAETVSAKPVLKKVFKNPVFRPCVPVYLRTWETVNENSSEWFSFFKVLVAVRMKRNFFVKYSHSDGSCSTSFKKLTESIFFHSSISLVLLGFRRDREDNHFEIV